MLALNTYAVQNLHIIFNYFIVLRNPTSPSSDGRRIFTALKHFNQNYFS